MRILVKRGPNHWLLYWKPLKGRNWYPISSANVAFVGALEQVRAKINALLQGQTCQAEFEAYYCRATKVELTMSTAPSANRSFAYQLFKKIVA